MPIVTVDGQEYIPANQDSFPLVAIGITTRNRRDVLMQTLKNLDAVTPEAWPVFIVDDAGDGPRTDITTGGRIQGVRHSVVQMGIPAAKNECLAMCMDSGADHFFLLDDDCYPAVENWWKPYVFGNEPHYNYIFTHWTNGSPVGDCEEFYNNGRDRAFTQARGCAMYLRRNVVDEVGGFNPIFGMGMNEHLEYSQRICNAGLTTFPYMDVCGADELWHSLDRAQTVTRTLPSAQRADLLKRNDIILENLSGSIDFVEYRTEQYGNLVITQLLTGNPDGQRGKRWDADPSIIDGWLHSITGAEPVCLTDQLESNHLFHKMPSGWDIPHLDRWAMSLAYLKDKTAQWVWLTDGSDVTMLREPWDEMQPGVLYVGSEPCSIGKPWLAEHHPFYRDWINSHPSLQMLNCGLVGGDIVTVMEFLRAMVRELGRAYGQIDYEMGSFNYLLRQPHWQNRIVTGPMVHTQFKADETNDFAWFKHK